MKVLKNILLSSSLTRIPVKVGLINARIQNENDCYTHRLIHQLDEQDLPYHSIEYVFDLGNITA